MKCLVWGASVVASFAFVATVSASDEVESVCLASQPPAEEDTSWFEEFCGCLAEQASDDETLAEELIQFGKMPTEERDIKFEAEASEGARAAIGACVPAEAAGD